MPRTALVLALAACSVPTATRVDLDAAPAADAPLGGADAGPGATAVYAHTASALYRIDPDALSITEVGAFQWPAAVGTDMMTDLAIDRHGVMIGISFGAVYRVDPMTAWTTLLSGNLSGQFNGLSFVPAAQVGATGDDVLIAARSDDGAIFRIDPATGAATQIGDMGHGYRSSGDIVSVVGLGTVATVTGPTSDILVRLAPVTFDATPIGTATGASTLWGVGFWKDRVFAFGDDGSFVLIDEATGVATPISTSPLMWWGAAVTTLAPVST